MQNVLVVQDISCFGKCSTTVALPILSHYQLTASILPTAILSTHTGPEFPGFIFTDLYSHMEATIQHWMDLGLKFDAIYTGYLGEEEHVPLLLEVIEKLLYPTGKVFVDPAFGDHGELYSGFDKAYVETQKQLIAVSDYIFPNYTEACYLLDKDYRDDGFSPILAQELAEELRLFGAQNVIMTGVRNTDQIGALMVGDKGSFESYAEFFDQVFHGTGDVFASVFVGEMMQSNQEEAALNQATKFVSQAIQMTLNDQDPIRYAVHFEKLLGTL
ncbi:pyridoxamine kinase [Facklamia sp. DSM 111018]|uniref:pyridoxal kinase n=1 Tax=Facklamia lactis TaxID=2749967 RepID=A0ABS0LR60_9LACT|nr:pyridoxamine kinase [Facklamia lactis]MBG9980987.1 pyridoxamine kinase [Facklamia lactis]MBG9986650.1 pyridoxamine kinase [Facklamia lactis]